MRESQAMHFAKETKRTVVYRVPEGDVGAAAVESVYVAKHALPEGTAASRWPESITLTLEAS